MAQNNNLKTQSPNIMKNKTSGIAVPHVREEFSSVRPEMLTIKGTAMLCCAKFFIRFYS
jgi:hypothetical protein